MTKRVFISRELRSDSPFRHLLQKEGFEIIGQSLITFSAIEFTSPPAADWVFCYSSRSADFFLAGLDRLGISVGRYPNYAALGKGTAAHLQQLGIRPAFIGSGAPEATARAFWERTKGQTVLFPRAEQSQQSIQRLLKDKLKMEDLIVYRNQKMEGVILPDTEYVVLTSPLNVQAYADNHGFNPTQRIVAIGNTTARALEQVEVDHYRIAEQAAEESLAETVVNWEKQGEG